MDQELIGYLDRRFETLDRRLDRRFDQQDRSIEVLKESHRHTQITVEGLRSDIQLVAEEVATVDQKLERYREAIDRRMEADQSLVQAGFKTLRRKDDELDRRVTRFEAGRLPG